MMAYFAFMPRKIHRKYHSANKLCFTLNHDGRIGRCIMLLNGIVNWRSQINVPCGAHIRQKKKKECQDGLHCFGKTPYWQCKQVLCLKTHVSVAFYPVVNQLHNQLQPPQMKAVFSSSFQMNILLDTHTYLCMHDKIQLLFLIIVSKYSALSQFVSQVILF